MTPLVSSMLMACDMPTISLNGFSTKSSFYQNINAIIVFDSIDL